MGHDPAARGLANRLEMRGEEESLEFRNGASVLKQAVIAFEDSSVERMPAVRIRRDVHGEIRVLIRAGCDPVLDAHRSIHGLRDASALQAPGSVTTGVPTEKASIEVIMPLKCGVSSTTSATLRTSGTVRTAGAAGNECGRRHRA